MGTFAVEHGRFPGVDDYERLFGFFLGVFPARTLLFLPGTRIGFPYERPCSFAVDAYLIGGRSASGQHQTGVCQPDVAAARDAYFAAADTREIEVA